jgi:hypothetical protein
MRASQFASQFVGQFASGLVNGGNSGAPTQRSGGDIDR